MPLNEPLPSDLGDGTDRSPRLIVDVWLAVPVGGDWRVLMLRRAPEHGGFWQGVSGGVESNDGTLADAARREMREEIGSDEGELVDLGRWIPFVSPYTGRSFRKRSLGVVLTEGTRAESVTLSEEHVEARLVSFDVARAMVKWNVNQEELREFERLLRE